MEHPTSDDGKRPAHMSASQMVAASIGEELTPSIGSRSIGKRCLNPLHYEAKYIGWLLPDLKLPQKIFRSI
jgi:hypothetical protein